MTTRRAIHGSILNLLLEIRHGKNVCHGDKHFSFRKKRAASFGIFVGYDVTFVAVLMGEFTSGAGSREEMHEICVKLQ